MDDIDLNQIVPYSCAKLRESTYSEKATAS